MSNQDRGMYRPSDEIRIFDGSEDEEDPEGSRLPLLIVLALLVLAMFGGVVWMAYSYGVVHGRGEPRVLAAEPGPARVAPANPGGTQTPYKGFKIYEQPAPADDEAEVASAPAPAAPVKKAAPAPAPAPQKLVVTVAPKVVAPPAPKPVIAPAAPAKKIVAAPVAAPVATAPPARLAPAAPKPEPVKAAAQPAKAAAPASGAYLLQIGAYKSPADADTAWRTYKAKHAALLDGYGPDVQQVELGEKGTWYRLRITGFASKDIASAMCDRLKSDGGSCFLGK